MLYREIPKTGEKLSVLGFGCMRLPQKNNRIDEERATRQVRHAIDQGVNYVDTAWPYHAGESESFLGRALSDGYREKVKIATKLPSWMIRARSDMDHYLNAQLKKLRTGHINYYLLHNLAGPMWDKLEKLGVLDFLDQAGKDGRIINAGFSFHGKLEDFKRIVDAYPWEFCQIQYNYLDEENQAGTEGLHYASSKGLGVIVMEPLRGGNLGLATPPPAVDAVWKETEKQRTPVEWARRWIWNHPEVTLVLSGMNEESHIEENLAIADQASPSSLTEAELQLIARAKDQYKKLMRVDCTGCGYCMPCPAKVHIPACFEVFNKMHMFGNFVEAKIIYAIRISGMVTGGESGYASQCVKCGECLEKCPQHIKIPTFLDEVAKELEGPDLKERETIGKRMLNID